MRRKRSAHVLKVAAMTDTQPNRVKINPLAVDVVTTWGTAHETSLQLVLEAQRRFTQITNDSRTAAALTLAWASLESRGG
jgi:hypothetical protein